MTVSDDLQIFAYAAVSIIFIPYVGVYLINLPRYGAECAFGFCAYFLQIILFIASVMWTEHTPNFNLIMIFSDILFNLGWSNNIIWAFVNSVIEEHFRFALFVIAFRSRKPNIMSLFMFGISYGVCEVIFKFFNHNINPDPNNDVIQLLHYISNANSMTEWVIVIIVILFGISISLYHVIFTIMLDLSRRITGFSFFGMLAAIVIHTALNAFRGMADIASPMVAAVTAMVAAVVLWRLWRGRVRVAPQP